VLTSRVDAVQRMSSGLQDEDGQQAPIMRRGVRPAERSDDTGILRRMA